MSPVETRAHFAAWAIVSSPLFLSHDISNDAVNEALWPIVGNPEAIAINQAWAGHAGTLFDHPHEPEGQLMNGVDWQRT